MNFSEFKITVIRNPADKEVEEPEDGVLTLDEECPCEECQINDNGMG
jgi:hypothetical protein